MKSSHYALIVALASASALSACGGGNNAGNAIPHTTSTATAAATATPPPSATATPTIAPAATPTASAAVTQSFVITIPASASAPSARHRSEASANTNSVRIALQSVNGHAVTLPATIVQTSAASPGCVASSGGLTCTIVANAAIGSDVFAVSSYQSQDGSGTSLASTTVAATVVATGNPPLTLTLSGVPSALAFSPAVLPLVNDGAIHRYTLTVDAIDASGATIVGAAAFQTPVSLQIVGDATHALSLSTASVTQPGTVVTVTFDGSKGLSNASIQASATGTATIALAAAPLTFTPASLTLYDDQTGGVSTTVVQTGFTGAFTAALANGNDGKVLLAAGPLGSGSAVANVVPSTIFDETTLSISNGTYAGTVPVTIIPHPGPYVAYGTQHYLADSTNLVEGPNGYLWTDAPDTGELIRFDPTPNTYTRYTVDPNDEGPKTVAFDTSGKLWFADGSQVGKFDPSTQTTTFYSTGLASDADVTSIATGPAGEMWFYDQESNSAFQTPGPSRFGKIYTSSGQIVEYAAPAGASPGVAIGPNDLKNGPDGALWFADQGNASIGRMDSFGHFSFVSIQTPMSPNLLPKCVVVGPDGNIWFASANRGLDDGYMGSVTPGTGALALYPLTVGPGEYPGDFNALILGSDHNFWYAESPSVGGTFDGQAVIGVFNPATHANYVYQSVLPQFASFAGLVDRGNRTLYTLDDAYGQIGMVPFK